MLKNFSIVLFAILTFVSLTLAESSKVILTLDKSVVKKNEKICFTLKNVSNSVVYMPNSAPWVIIGKSGKYKGKIVYAPVVMPVLTPLEPNQFKKWCWDLKDFNDFSAPSGKYEVRITLFINKKKVFISKEFEIKPLYSIIDEKKK